jgi:hypothetical protein
VVALLELLRYEVLRGPVLRRSEDIKETAMNTVLGIDTGSFQ